MKVQDGVEEEEEEQGNNIIFVEQEDVFEDGVSLFDMLTHKVEILQFYSGDKKNVKISQNINASHDNKAILEKCMGKNFFSRFRVGNTRTKPFYIRM
jgi:hypothetical protein